MFGKLFGGGTKSQQQLQAGQQVEFIETTESLEDKAARYGKNAQGKSLVALSVFEGLAPIFLLISSIILGVLEANLSAELIRIDNQFWRSFGLTGTAILFSIIGFHYRKLQKTLEAIKADAPITWEPLLDKKLYQLYLEMIDNKLKLATAIWKPFLFGNLIITALVLVGNISAINNAADPTHNEYLTSVWIYTLAISGLSLMCGAAVSIITASPVSDEHLLEEVYRKANRVQETKKKFDNLGKP